MLFSSGVLLLIYLPWFCAQCVELTDAVINRSGVSLLLQRARTDDISIYFCPQCCHIVAAQSLAIS